MRLTSKSAPVNILNCLKLRYCEIFLSIKNCKYISVTFSLIQICSWVRKIYTHTRCGSSSKSECRSTRRYITSYTSSSTKREKKVKLNGANTKHAFQFFVSFHVKILSQISPSRKMFSGELITVEETFVA